MNKQIVDEIKNSFITISQQYEEGQVFTLKQKWELDHVVHATLYMTALGIYEAKINGNKVGDQIFAPGYTYYPKDLFYQTYDITDMINKGQNNFEVLLAQGWYCGRFTFENKTQIYGERPAASWVLVIENEEGEIKRISSNTQVSVWNSKYEYAGFYDGEVYDASKEIQKLGQAMSYNGEVPEHLEETYVKVQIQEEMQVVEAIQREDSVILDFGQNFAGIVCVDMGMMPEGATITLLHGEILNQDGTLYRDNLRKAKAMIVCKKGKELGEYIPKFTYMGFRYVEVTGVAYKEGMIKAYALYTQMKRTGFFSCKNKKVEKLYNNQLWGQKSNYVEVPTDCPQRDERMGYTGDGHVFAWTGSFNFNTELFWKKFLKDVTYSQLDNTEGYIGSTVPATGPAGIGFLSMLGWGNAVTLIPEMLYQQYGKQDYLLNQYNSIKAFVDAEISKMGKKNLWIGPSLGDWLMPGKGMAWAAMHNQPVSNSFIVHDLEVLSTLARILDKKDDYEKYIKQLENTRSAYIKKFVSATGKIKGDYQGAYVMALHFVVRDETIRVKMMKRLVALIRKQGMQTGFFATEHLLPLLVDAGETKLAYDLLLQENCPGWMYQINCGATTTWERWDALKEDGTVKDEKVAKDNMVSFNHYAFGSVGEFYYRYILGINPEIPGYKKIRIRPVTDERLGEVTGSYESVEGKISVHWLYLDEKIQIDIDTPQNAKIILPDGKLFEVTAGKYQYFCDK